MKILKIIFIILCLFISINSSCATDEDETNKYRNALDCKNKAFDSDEIEVGAYKCCYIEVEYKSLNSERETHGCTALTESQYNNIRQTIRTFEAQTGVYEVDIECKSSYIKYGLFLIILFLL